MAVLDTDANEVVIRVVYDGSPEAGKTTSLRALAGRLGQEAVTPEQDPSGRTLWFDWMEYLGGRFEGAQIRCQIVSVPGQRELAERRRRLVAGADVVVSVLDSAPAKLAPSLASLEELRRQLRALPGPPIGIVLQANKRDVPGAVPLDEIRAALGGWSVGVVESIAADGTGIREAFVYAVRLALDRVRELMLRGELASGPPELRGADDLMGAMRSFEVVESNPTSVAASLLLGLLDSEEEARVQRTPVARGGEQVPLPPTTAVPSGAIWPPVEGRAILQEVSRLGLEPHRLATGDWILGLGSGWRIVSRRDACFESLDEGRAALIQWARLHATSLPMISAQRCIVLADTGTGAWRLWQIVRVEESLRELMTRVLDEETPESIVFRMCQSGKWLVDTATRVAQSPCDLPCTLDTVGSVDGFGRYIGLMPSAGVASARPILILPALLRTELAPVVALARSSHRGDEVRQALDRLPRPAIDTDAIMSTLLALFT